MTVFYISFPLRADFNFVSSSAISSPVTEKDEQKTLAGADDSCTFFCSFSHTGLQYVCLPHLAPLPPFLIQHFPFSLLLPPLLSSAPPAPLQYGKFLLSTSQLSPPSSSSPLPCSSHFASSWLDPSDPEPVGG